MPADKDMNPTRIRLDDLEQRVSKLEVIEAVHVKHLHERITELEATRCPAPKVTSDIMRSIAEAIEGAGQHMAKRGTK